jgi:uncharacterized coiled-coil DUF342 family protein
MEFSPEKMRARFAELRDKRDRLQEKAAPLRLQRDGAWAKALEERAKLDTKIARAEDGLFEAEQELAALSRALNGKVEAAE